MISPTKISVSYLPELPRLAVIRAAQHYGYRYLGEKADRSMLRFCRKEKGRSIRINVYYTTRTVQTTLDHWKHGRRQLTRRNISMGLLKKILQYPRLHTGRGYFEKPVKKEGDKLWVTI